MRKYNSIAQVEDLNTIGFDLVLNAKSALLDAQFHQIEESFAQVMERFYQSLIKENH
jgi:hypothetical protein